MEKALSLGIDPFEVLLFFAGNRWQKLGYKSADAISPELRKASAEAASQYLYPKRKAIEVTGRDGGPLDFYLTMSPEERQRRRAELEKRLKKQ